MKRKVKKAYDKVRAAVRKYGVPVWRFFWLCLAAVFLVLTAVCFGLAYGSGKAAYAWFKEVTQ